MKKVVILIAALLLCLGSVQVMAEEVQQKQGMDWEISMMPKETEEEKEASRWSVVVENELGIYAYDMTSFTYSAVENGVPDKNIVTVLTKTVFTDKETLKKLNAKYGKALAKKEKVQYCEILMEFNLSDKAYRVRSMNVYGSKKTLLEGQAKEGAFAPVPQGTFAEAMLEICQKAVTEDSGKQ